jgi:uncharacterized protein
MSRATERLEAHWRINPRTVPDGIMPANTKDGRGSVMHPIIVENLKTIASICRQHGVRKLEVFGSASRGDFDQASSDIDFVVDFIDYGPGVADRYFSFIEALEALFGRHVDLVFERKLTNPYFVRSINESRRVIYESGDRQIAA